MSPEIPVQSFPLCWPDGQPRTPRAARKRGQFNMTLGVAVAELRDEVGRLGARDLIVSTNVRTKPNGMPYAGEREPDDPGVAVYFTWGKGQRAVACDTYDAVWKNIRAITHCLDALRALERHGSSAILERAFRGFAALPAAATVPSWWQVLGVPPDASPGEIEDAYRRKALETHPDKGGSAEAFARVAEARAAALGEGAST